MKKKKMDDLKKMVPMLYTSGEWITTLFEEQNDAIDYKEDEDERYFVTSIELINEVPVRIDASQQSDDP